MKKVAIMQSNYIPWKGYFDMINMVDEFVIYDDAQYTKRDWRNRNIIKTKDGLKWLTIPVEVKGRYKQTIRETKISDSNWVNQHLKTLSLSQTNCEYFKDMIGWINTIYRRCENETYLSDINLNLINEIIKFLGIKTKITLSSDYIIEGNRSEKIMNICTQAGASVYLSGPAAKSYLDIASFEKESIAIRWMNYTGYKEYPQAYSSFVNEVSILDLILNTGNQSVNYLKSF